VRRLATIAALGALLCVGRAHAQSGAPVPTEEGIVAVQCGTFLSTEVVARFGADTTVYVPFDAFCDLFAIKHRSAADSVIAEVPTGSLFSISRAARTLRRGDSITTLDERSLLDVDGTFFVELATISHAFGLQFGYDPGNVRIFVSPDRRLPIIANELGERRREALGVYESDMSDPTDDVSVTRRLLGMPVLDWSADWTARRDMFDASGGFRFGLPALFGTLSGGGGARLDGDSTRRIVGALESATWELALPYLPVLRRIELSTSSTTGERGYGARLSNASLSSRRTDGLEYAITGYTQPAWIVELYDGEQLLQATQADTNGAYSFAMPLDRSTITVSIHQVGPNGERIVSERLIERPIDLLHGGVVEYDLSAASTLRPRAPVAGSASVQVGITDWLTLGARERLRPSPPGMPRLDSLDHQPFVNLWLGSSGSLGVEYDPVPGVARATLDMPLWGDLRARLDGIEVAKDLSRFGAGTSLSVGLGSLMASAVARYDNHNGASIVTAKPALSGYFSGVSFSAASDLRWAPHREAVGESIDTLPNGPIESSLQLVGIVSPSFMLGGDLTYDHAARRASRMTAWTSLGLASWLRVGASYRVENLDWKRAGFELTIGIDLSAARLRSRTDRRNEVTSNRTSLEGSLVLSPAGFHTRNTSMVGQSAVVVRAFNDINGNGVRDGAEQVVGNPRTTLRGGGGSASSEEGRHYSVMPDAEYLVEVDPYSFADEGLFPRRTHYAIYALANNVEEIDVPLSVGEDLTGTFMLVDGKGEEIRMSSSVFNGLRVRVRAVDGSATYDGEAFSDGSLYVIGVAPGEYRIEPDARQLAMRRIRMRGEPRTWRIGGGAPPLESIAFERVPEAP
jgi:hypothetical protein